MNASGSPSALIDDVRRGPWADARNGEQLGIELFRVECRRRLSFCRPLRPSAKAISALLRPAGIGKASGEVAPSSASASAVGKVWVTPKLVSLSGDPASFDESACDRPGSCHRDLLSDDRTRGQLEAVCGARNPDTRQPLDEWSQERVLRKSLVDCDRIRVEVAEVPASCDRCSQVAQVLEREHRAHEAVVWRKSYRSRSRSAGASSACTVRLGSLDARDRARPEEVEKCPRRERLSVGQPQGDRLRRYRTKWFASLSLDLRLDAERLSSVGVLANTDLTVSLNWRTLAKPAANATCVTGSSVVSRRRRAVCARCARASASAPVPTSAIRTRCSCLSP